MATIETFAERFLELLDAPSSMSGQRFKQLIVDAAEGNLIFSNIGEGIYGNGIDGTQVISANTSIQGHVYYEDLTVDPGWYLNLASILIFVRGTLTVNGKVWCRPNDATGNAGAAATPNGTSGQGEAGGKGGVAGVSDGVAGVSRLYAPHGNNGGAGGAGNGVGGVAGAGGVTSILSRRWAGLNHPQEFLYGRLNNIGGSSLPKYGGAGGGGGGADGAGGFNGGGGGSGGAWCPIFARQVVNNGEISAPGGAGAPGLGGDASGGGGGAAGAVFICTRDYQGAQPVAPGGLGGAGQGSGANGADGGDGFVKILSD